MSNHQFSLEQLENRLETFCIYMPYTGICYKKVWFVTISYPCIKFYRICF